MSSPASAAATPAALAATTATAWVGLGGLRQKLQLPVTLLHDAGHDVPVLGLEDRSSSKLGGFGTLDLPHHLTTGRVNLGDDALLDVGRHKWSDAAFMEVLDLLVRVLT